MIDDKKPVTYLQHGLLQKRGTIVVTHVQHGLIMGVGVRAKDIKAALTAIPDDAKIVDIEDFTENVNDRMLSNITDASVYVFETETKASDDD